MKLHRTTGRPDWADVPPKERNVWQNLGSATHSYVTPGNIITVAGFILVLYALSSLLAGAYWTGLIALALGRAFDLLDGLVADYTRTKSPLGEALDASIDKVVTFLTLAAVAVSAIAPWWLVGLLAAPHVIITVLVFQATRGGYRLHPSRLGKLSMAAAWASLLGLVVVRALGLALGSPAGLCMYFLALVSVAIGTRAAISYLRTRS